MLNRGRRVTAQGRRLVYESGEWEVDLARRELRARGVPVPIGGRAFEIIEVLVARAGEVVAKNDLMERVWPGAVVEDNTLQFHISAIRKALGPNRGMLKTASGRGYRLVGAWTLRQESVPAGEQGDVQSKLNIASENAGEQQLNDIAPSLRACGVWPSGTAEA